MRDKIDIGAVKRLEALRNKDLWKITLDMTDDLGSLVERNKYIVVANPILSTMTDMPGDLASLAARADEYTNATDRLTSSDVSKTSQLSHFGQVSDMLDNFVLQNTEFWKVANDYVYNMNEKRQATYKNYEKDSK